MDYPEYHGSPILETLKSWIDEVMESYINDPPIPDDVDVIVLSPEEYKIMDEKQKTADQLRQEMIEKLQREKGQFLQEIAIPGVRQDVNLNDN